MVKVFLIGICICWFIAFAFPVILKMISKSKSSRKDNGDNDIEKP